MQLYKLTEDEKEIDQIRKIGLFIVFQAVWHFLLRSFALGLIIFGISFLFGFNAEAFSIAVAIFMIILAYFVLLAYIEWFNEEIDILIITNKRIIIFIQHTLFKRQSAVTDLEKIQDVQGIMNGFVQHMFNVGTVHIQTAADKIRFEIDQVHNPEKVADIINMAILEANKSKQSASAKSGVEDDSAKNAEILHESHYSSHVHQTREKLRGIL